MTSKYSYSYFLCLVKHDLVFQSLFFSICAHLTSFHSILYSFRVLMHRLDFSVYSGSFLSYLYNTVISEGLIKPMISPVQNVCN